MIKIKYFTFNGFAENTYILSDESNSCIIIDPGCYNADEQQELVNYIEENNLIPKEVINTHCHIDHVLGNKFIKEKFGIPLRIPELEQEVYFAVSGYSAAYGFTDYQSVAPDSFIKKDEKITFGNSILEVLFVPGHSPGHLAFYSKEQNFCINGDVLFHGSIGRTDLPGGDFKTLISSIHNVMFNLPDETEIYCGHGPKTNVAFEKASNPFCAIKA